MILKGLKSPLQNQHQYRSAARFTLSCCKMFKKGGVCRCAVEMLLGCKELCELYGVKYYIACFSFELCGSLVCLLECDKIYIRSQCQMLVGQRLEF